MDMNDYQAPADFTDRVMTTVRTYEAGRKVVVPIEVRLLHNSLWRWGLSCSAALLGGLHLLRLCFNLLAPVVCR
jgi:hypothetical protein